MKKVDTHPLCECLLLAYQMQAALCGRPPSVAGRFPVHPVGEGLAPPAGFRNFSVNVGECPMGRRAGSSRPTGVMVREGRAGQETRPYKAISVLGDMATAAAMKPHLSLRNQMGLLKTP